MASRRQISYKWRLFIQLTLILWVFIGCMIFFQYSREKAAKADTMRSQVTFITSRIIAAHDKGINIDEFLDYVNEYINLKTLDDIRLTVYNVKTGEMLHHIGEPLPNEENIAEVIKQTYGRGVNKYGVERKEATPVFFQAVENSNDGEIRTITILPYSAALSDAIQAYPRLWAISAFVVIIALFVAYGSASFVSRNIRQLRDFTNRAADDLDFVGDVKFPNDELGEISRQIVNIYNKRSQALKDLEYEHLMAMKATKEKARIKREMTNNINHEIKTPIGIIKGYIDTIVENPDMPSEQRMSFLTKAQANVDRLVSMVNDLSTITRLEDAADSVPTEPIDLHELAYTVADELRESGVIGKMKFSYDIPFDCIVKGNGNLLRGMLLNLAKNAANYSQGTEMTLKMVGQNDKFYTFTFYDNGVGVEERHIPYLFDRFYRVDSGRSRKAGGTGLGLPIIKNTVISLGGTISVKNRQEGGLEFFFTLPKDKMD